ncbi:MAG: DUF4158 domain-containing protein, partial [Rickettsiaceae bacterium]|nr:DUF4158 domain-containing protein [Rickettsiaceae bacterium]
MANKNTNILNASELLEIYGTPVFSDAECSEYFRLSPAEIKVLKSFKDVSNSMHFVICLVFFKLNKTLVDFSYRETTAQRRHVMERYFPNSSTPKTTVKDKNTIARIENTVLSLCDHQRYQGEIAVLIQQELQKQAQNNPRQRQLCKALLDLLTKHQVAIPGYTTVQNIISTVSNRENNRLIKTYVRYTNKTDRDSILSLMTKDDDGLHHIVSIRQDMRGFNTTELNKEIDKHIKLQPIFEAAINVIPKLNLPTATINYYGPSVREAATSRHFFSYNDFIKPFLKLVLLRFPQTFVPLQCIP